MHPPISLQSPLTKGYLDFFLEKSLITQGNDTTATFSPFLSAAGGMHFFVLHQQHCQLPYSLWNTAPHISWRCQICGIVSLVFLGVQ